MCNLLPHDQNARRLSKQSFTLAEFLDQYSPDYDASQLPRKAIVHGHCHHKSVLDSDMDAEQALYKKLGLDFEMLDSGCCGMAGSFGFESEHFAVSQAVGERVLLPTVREADRDTLVVADGFSCQQQIEQLTPRRALHTAQVLKMAMEDQKQCPQHLPERHYVISHRLERYSTSQFMINGAAILIGGLAGFQMARNLRRS